MVAATPSPDPNEWARELKFISFSATPVAHGSDKTHALFRLKVETTKKEIPKTLQHGDYLCLSWQVGGLWKVKSRQANELLLEASKRMDVSTQDFATLNTQRFANPPSLDTRPLFEWTMKQRAGGDSAWYVAEIPLSWTDQPHLSAWQPTTLPRVEVSLDIAAIHDIDTVRQRYTADVTWKVTLPNVTAVREESILHEFLSQIAFDETAFSFTNALDVRTQDVIAMEFPSTDRTEELATGGSRTRDTTSPELFDLQFSRRVVAEFTAQMDLRAFPFDQQTLSFAFAMGRKLGKLIAVAPSRVDPGRFVYESFALANVWRTPTWDMVFGEAEAVKDNAAAVKTITFEILIERRATHHLTNIALPAMILTYMCFSSYAPIKTGQQRDADAGSETANDDWSQLMDTDARLQIVVALLLTAVTFKNQVAASIPQVSYFTVLDMYTFLCFFTAFAVATESALFPICARIWGLSHEWREFYLVFPSLGSFTVINIGAAGYLYRWKNNRRRHLDWIMSLLASKQAVSSKRDWSSERREAELGKYINQHRSALTDAGISNLGTAKELLDDSKFTTHIKDDFIKLPRLSLWLPRPVNETAREKRIKRSDLDQADYNRLNSNNQQAEAGKRREPTTPKFPLYRRWSSKVSARSSTSVDRIDSMGVFV